ncbi:TetR/AcrR family transcriptional regulator [Mumia zhuanghuii]|uniref:WHG domain-containing protein n=1 Tax=Mumia zhuanghuii TaxID=2585211 RepID=A0A5C4MYR5_9ACTN|nr:TetR-like C-terminal domain-containing protein [Mumia zhuanghuii]TNC48394.1 WHG domain-containing protein [Mumia zhuanghuii]TNC51313.1 WHG domain-containing protein [Mumia zhuanghuii]
MPRVGLNRDRVVSVALDVVDAGGRTGFADLTLAAVASAAGVSTPSLYKHVPSLAALRRDIAVRAVEETVRTTARATIGRSGPEAVRALGHAIRDYAREHPGRYAAVQVAADPDDPDDAPLADAGADAVAVLAAVVRGAGVADDRLVDAVRILRSAVHGFVTLELDLGFRLPDDLDASFDALLDVVVTGLAALGDPVADPPRHR